MLAKMGLKVSSKGLHLATRGLVLPERNLTKSARVVRLPITAIRGLK